MPRVNIMIKPASSLCNLQCDYCFYRDEAETRYSASYGMMTTEILDAVLKRTLEYAQEECTIAYQGGEPTLRGLQFFEHSVESEKKYNKRHVKIHHALQTNGLLLDDKWCNFLKKNEFLIGISLDGRKKTHDKHRPDSDGEGTFFKVMETINRLKKFEIPYNILTVVTEEIAVQAESIYKFYQKNDFSYLQFIPCIPPFETGEEKGLFLSPKSYGGFLNTVFDLWYADLMKNKQPYIQQFENLIMMRLGYPPDGCDQCGHCAVQYVVEANGSVYPCDFYALDHYCLGNLVTDDFSKLNQRQIEIGFIERSMTIPERCKKCSCYTLCRGGCRRMRRETECAIEENIFCESYQTFFSHCASRIDSIAQQVLIQSSKGGLV